VLSSFSFEQDHLDPLGFATQPTTLVFKVENPGPGVLSQPTLDL